MPDGISTAPELKALLVDVRAAEIQTRLAVLVATVARLTIVSEATILTPSHRRSFPEQDARRIAMVLSRAWLGGRLSVPQLAELWHTPHQVYRRAHRRHADFCQTDPIYLKLTNDIRDALLAEDPAATL